MSDLTLKLSRTINAPIESVFNAWLDPQMLAKFMLAADGMTIPEASNDPRVGGGFRIIMKMGDNAMPHTGEYIAIDPYSLLIFSWQSPHSIDGSTVSLKFTKAAKGTLVELTQVKFLNEERRDAHRAGWTAILNKLDEVLS